jgi:glycerophosphoryl diester phosphodiesterase
MNTRPRWIRIAIVASALLSVLAPSAVAKKKSEPPQGQKHPLVIGHRGAPGYLPDHTLQGYARAIRLGADYVEPDLVATKDGVLIARHEPNITGTTDVADHPEFADRFDASRFVDGVEESGWFASDFTLAEIKTLGAKQPFAERPQKYNGKFEIPTLQEVIDLVNRKSRSSHRKIGIYPETKHPTYHQTLVPPLPLEQRLVDVLAQNGLNRANAPVFIQSFEQANLQQLNTMTPVRLVQLVDAFDTNALGDPIYFPPNDRPFDWTVSGRPDLYSYFATNDGLAEIKTYADGIGPWKVYIVGTFEGNIIKTTDLIDRAHAHGLLIHTWTFRSESFRLANQYNGDPANEYKKFYELGIDGVFSDFPDHAVEAREEFLAG